MNDSTQKKLGVRPETHEAFGRINDHTGIPVSRLVDDALALLIKSCDYPVQFSPPPRTRRTRRPAAA